MPPAFEVSYSSVAYRTQKRCQVAIVKSYPWRGVALSIIVLTSWEKRPSCEHRGRTEKCVMGGNASYLSRNGFSASKNILKIQIMCTMGHVCMHPGTSLPLFFQPARECAFVVLLLSFHNSHYQQVLVWLGSQKILNHMSIAYLISSSKLPKSLWLLYLLTAASVFVQHHHLSAAYLFISLTVCPDRIKKSENVAL